MRSKLLVDILFSVLISVVVTVLAVELYVKPSIDGMIPKVAIIGIDHEPTYEELFDDPEGMRRLAKELKAKGDLLAEKGYIVLDAASIVSANESYRAN